jgi:hypothetical protein
MRSWAKIVAIPGTAGFVGPVCGIIAALLLNPAPQRAIATANSNASGEYRKPEAITGRITWELADGTRCFLGQFNNATGRISGMGDTCSVSIGDSTGVLAPMGTIHRLESIQKSFFEDKEVKSNTS